MATISLTLTDRQYDGFVVAANGAGMTPEALALEFLANQGARYADGFKIGVLTSAAFIKRLAPQEYAGIVTAAESSSEIAGLVEQFTQQPMIALDDERLIAGLQQLVEIGLLTQERKAELLLYQRPQPRYERARDEQGRFIPDDPSTPDVNEAWVTTSQPS